MQSINPCFVHKILTVRTNALFLLVSYHQKAAGKKAVYMEEFSTVRRSILFILQ